MDDWSVTLIERVDNRKELKRWESFWQYKLNTFFPHGLNERNLPAEHQTILSFTYDKVQVILQNLLERLFTGQIYRFTLMLFYCCLLCCYRIYSFITFAKQQFGEKRFFLIERHCLTLFVNCARQAILCSMFVSSPLYGLFRPLIERYFSVHL